MPKRELILSYIDVDSFVNHFAQGLKDSYVSQHGAEIPQDIQDAIEASRVALSNNRKWFEDKLVEGFPSVVTEQDLEEADRIRKTPIFQQVKKMLGILELDLVLSKWAAELTSDWRDATPELKTTTKLVGLEAPLPIEHPGTNAAAASGEITTPPAEPPPAAA